MPSTSPTITACILARNEERRIADALRSLQGWTHEILVIDNESEDGTVEVARRYTDRVLTAPRAVNFDALRGLAIEHAAGGWIFYLDADERVPPALGPVLRQLVQERGDQFEALLIPFKHYFCGKWIQHSGWSPGYTRPQLLKKGRFRYNERLHSGVEVDGRVLRFPADNPDLAILHYSYDDLHHYLEKLNRYTDGEAENLLADGAPHTWQAQLAHFVVDWQQYYERGRGDLDGMHGFVLAFMSAFYRFAARAKLWDLRRQAADGRREAAGPADLGPTTDYRLPSTVSNEPVPGTLREMLDFMAHVAQQGPGHWLSPSPNASPFVSSRLRVNPENRLPLLWRGPLFGASGFADEARQFVLGLIEAGEPIALAPEDWRDGDPGLPAAVRARLEERIVPEDTPAEVCVHHTLLRWVRPSPHARVNVVRALFETDRLPEGAPERLNAMDRVWVPSEFNRETFVRSGVDPDKIAVIPEALDPAPFAAPDLEPWPLPGEEAFRFLAVFDWTLHKGWDVLLEAFAREFGLAGSSHGHRGHGEGAEAEESVGLILKVWSSNGYALADMKGQADAWLRQRVGRGLPELPNIHFWQEMVPAPELPRVYQAVEAFVLRTRGEGWCRPLMEAMAAGRPTIATAWSGLTAFHNSRVGYPLPYRLMPVSAAGAAEIPLYAGHCWAEPDVAALRRLMRELVEDTATAGSIGLVAQHTIDHQCSRAAVTARLREELALCREQAGLNTKTRRHEAECTGIDRIDRISGRQVAADDPVCPVHLAGLPAAGRVPPSPASRLPVSTASRASDPDHSDPVHPVHPCEFPSPCLRACVVGPAAGVDFRARLGRPLRVRWEGHQATLSSLALVNRQFCLGLQAAGDVEFSLSEIHNPWPDLEGTEDPRLRALSTTAA